VFSWLRFANARFTLLLATTPSFSSTVSPPYCLFVSGEDFQQSSETEMSAVGKAADDCCSWDVQMGSTRIHTEGGVRFPTYIRWNLFLTKLRFLWKTEIHYGIVVSPPTRLCTKEQNFVCKLDMCFKIPKFVKLSYFCPQKNNINQKIILLLKWCKIWSFHGDDYEEWRLQGCYAVWILYELTFRRNLEPPSSGWQESAS
jgi:hypothetical protein